MLQGLEQSSAGEISWRFSNTTSMRTIMLYPQMPHSISNQNETCYCVEA
uniref:Uncharacterized protein n=1 Tax=Arundo donax TaxID=35708 RepID=A0A0A9CJT9_ARUDO